MWKSLSQFIRDEAGCVVIGSWALISTVLVLGAAAGLIAAHEVLRGDHELAPSLVNGR